MVAAQVPTAAKVRELQRELALRRSFYPKLVASGKLDQKEADWRLEILEAILDDYKQRERRERPLSRDEYIKRSDGDFD
jgi:hypothetical protein